MKVYLKSGKTIQVSQKTANALSGMLKNPEEVMLLFENTNLVLFIDINEIAAIK